MLSNGGGLGGAGFTGHGGILRQEVVPKQAACVHTSARVRCNDMDDNTQNTAKPRKRGRGSRPVIHPRYAARPTDRELALREARDRERDKYGAAYEHFCRERIAAGVSDKPTASGTEAPPIDVPDTLNIDTSTLEHHGRTNCDIWVHRPKDGWALVVANFHSSGDWSWRVERYVGPGRRSVSAEGNEHSLAGCLAKAEESYLRRVAAFAKYGQGI